MLSIFLTGLRLRPLGRKEHPATSEAKLLYRARIGEGMQTPSQSLVSSQRDVSLGRIRYLGGATKRLGCSVT